jgi:hypothetical protein
MAAPDAHAGAQQGVKCPSGFDAVISNGDKKLVCRTTKRYELKTICSPVVFTSRGLKLPVGNIVMDPVGRDGGIDQCFAVGGGDKVDAAREPLLPGYPPISEFTFEKNPTTQDKWVATRVEYAFPEGTAYPVGSPANGVSCPSGYDGDKVFNGRGIRCDKYDGSPKPADCDGIAAGPVAIGWRWSQDHVGSEDRCVPMGSGSDGPTKPQGMTKVQHDAERASDDIGWILSKKSGARDTWQRKVYAFPNHN